MGYDLIGDIHGEAPTLTVLLDKLGYKDTATGYAHPDNRIAIFVGDLVDRGWWQREVIHIVRTMVDAGRALCVMGNHEFNAIAYGTLGPHGTPLREHSDKNFKQHAAFLAAFENSDAEYHETLAWFRTLPLWIDLPELRVIHACWDQKAIDFLLDRYGKPILTDELLVEASTWGTKEFLALETLLKGKEISLPHGAFYHDKEGTRRTVMRTKWWGSTGSYRDCYMGPEEAREHLPDVPIVGDPLVHYSRDEPPVFIGHYWLNGVPTPLADNIACLDYSVAKDGGSLVGYRFDGERTIDSGKYIAVDRIETCSRDPIE